MYPPEGKLSNPRRNSWSSVAKTAMPYVKKGIDYIAKHPEIIKTAGQAISDIRNKKSIDKDSFYRLTEPGARRSYPPPPWMPHLRNNPPMKVTVNKLIPAIELDKYQLTQRIKAMFPREDKQALYGRYVQQRDLKPDIDAKEFYQIFDSVGPNMYIKREELDFNPTHIYKVTGLKVMLFKDENGNYKFVDERGGTGGWPFDTKIDADVFSDGKAIKSTTIKFDAIIEKGMGDRPHMTGYLTSANDNDNQYKLKGWFNEDGTFRIELVN
jgi:hypothetical protein